MIALPALIAAAATAEIAKEYQIKAAFLYNFTKFVEWPHGQFPTVDTPLIIGVLGRNPFGDELETVVRDRTVNGHRIQVVYLHRTPDAVPLPVLYHVLFVGAGEEALFSQMIRSPLGGSLTVGESPGFADRAVVTFVVVGDKVRFEINADAADRAGLKVSAQLQKLATAVHRKP